MSAAGSSHRGTRCDVCGAVATHDVHNDPSAVRAVCDEHARSYWPHPTPMRADYATRRPGAPSTVVSTASDDGLRRQRPSEGVTRRR